MEWMMAHAALLQVAASAVTAMIWIIYLQIFLSGAMRQQRSMVLITAGGGLGLNSHCLVTNLGLEPISILSIILDMSDGERTVRAVIPERNEMMTPEGNEDAAATNQGPLASGALRDIGRFATLMDRAAGDNADIAGMQEIRWVEVTVVIATASSLAPKGARRRFSRMTDANQKTCFRPTTVSTAQLQSRRDRRRLLAILRADMAE